MLRSALLCRSCGRDVVETGGDEIFKSLIRIIPGCVRVVGLFISVWPAANRACYISEVDPNGRYI